MISANDADIVRNLVSKGYIDDLKASLTQNSNFLGVTDNLGNTLIHFASGAGRENVLEYLLSQKGSEKLINKKNHAGDTPLHKAVFRNNVECIKVLLKKGADPKATNADNKVPSDLTNHDETLVALGKKSEDDIDIKNNDSDED